MKKLYKPSVIVLLLAILVSNAANFILLNQKVRAKDNTSDSLQTELLASSSGEEQKYAIGMYSWEDEPYLSNTRAAFYETLESLQITELYQYFSDENLYSDDARTLIPELENMGIDLYYLTGASEWALDTDASKMYAVINKIAAFNKALPLQKRGSGFDGVLFDVEPYLTEEWKQDEKSVMKSYVQAMTKAYKYAKKKKLKVIICLPNWFDNEYKKEIESLIANACDEVAIMNYNRKDEKGSMETEVTIAKKYKKAIHCVMEFQKEGQHELTSNETYYSQGLSAARESFDRLYSSFQYKGLKFAYHYYLPVRELLNKQ